MPLKYWGFCVSTVVYLLNILPKMCLHGNSPFEKYGHLPQFSHLKVFRSLCYDTDPKKVDMFSLRVVPAIHLGYSQTQKVYILYDLASKSFFVIRKLKKEVFPSKELKSSPHLLFQVVSFLDELSLVDSSWSIDYAVSFSLMRTLLLLLLNPRPLIPLRSSRPYRPPSG